MECIVYGVMKSRTRLSHFHFHFTFSHIVPAPSIPSGPFLWLRKDAKMAFLERQENDRRLQEMVSSKYSLLIELLGPVAGVDVGK